MAVSFKAPVCSACDLPALFETPYGRFCHVDTLEKMRIYDHLWMPQLIERDVRISQAS